MTVYYNEIDPYAAQWLRNLIAAGHIAAGDVDERSIVDVRADDLARYNQCHFFAGIGGWSLALRLAGWPDDRHAWTGSCPCQPLSSAGQRKGHADERHLWPSFYRLISECSPAIIFGEQVASKDGLEWLSGVRADLEALGHSCGAADLCAAGVGAPHNRPRIFWMAYSSSMFRIVGKDHGTGCGEPIKKVPKPRDRDRPKGGPRGNWENNIPGLCEVADGISARVEQLRAYGNAIVPQVAAEFIAATEQALSAGQ